MRPGHPHRQHPDRQQRRPLGPGAALPAPRSGGPSRERAYAYFLYPPQAALTEIAERLAAISRFTELGAGFNIAMKDLEIRGAGNLLGAEQHGHIARSGSTRISSSWARHSRR